MHGKIVSISVLQNVFEDILNANSADHCHCKRNVIKKLLQSEIREKEFYKHASTLPRSARYYGILHASARFTAVFFVQCDFSA